jgi:hypothetical protein
MIHKETLRKWEIVKENSIYLSPSPCISADIVRDEFLSNYECTCFLIGTVFRINFSEERQLLSPVVVAINN